jgi:ZIP family zinc transporter
MLPSSKRSLEAGGFSPKEASWIMIACFIGGVVGIQIISRWMHHFVPHNVVECEHQHNEEESLKERENARVVDDDHNHEHEHRGDDNEREHRHSQMAQRQPSLTNPHLAHLQRPQSGQRATSHRSFFSVGNDTSVGVDPDRAMTSNRASSRPRTLQTRITEGITQLATGKDADCHDDGPCYGYSDTCPPACFRTISARASRASLRGASNPTNGLNRPVATKSVTATESTPLLHEVSQSPLLRPNTQAAAEGGANIPSHLEPGLSKASSTTAVADGHSHHNTHSHLHSHGPEHHDEDSPDHYSRNVLA